MEKIIKDPRRYKESDKSTNKTERTQDDSSKPKAVKSNKTDDRSSKKDFPDKVEANEKEIVAVDSADIYKSEELDGESVIPPVMAQIILMDMNTALPDSEKLFEEDLLASQENSKNNQEEFEDIREESNLPINFLSISTDSDSPENDGIIDTITSIINLSQVAPANFEAESKINLEELIETNLFKTAKQGSSDIALEENNKESIISGFQLRQEEIGNKTASQKNSVLTELTQPAEQPLKISALRNLTETQAEETKPLTVKIVSANPNLVLADDSQEGREIITRMNKSEMSAVTGKNTPQVDVQELGFTDEFKNDGDKDDLSKDFAGNKAVKSEEKNPAIFISNGFKSTDNTAGVKLNLQIVSAIKDVVNINHTGKSELVINLFPEELGAIRVEIITMAGDDNVKKIQSIKIISDRKETLEILENAKAELEKSLKSVADIKDERLLRFEMGNQNNRENNNSYFSANEEREKRMNNFIIQENSDNIDKDEESISSATNISSGYISKDNIDMKV